MRESACLNVRGTRRLKGLVRSHKSGGSPEPRGGVWGLRRGPAPAAPSQPRRRRLRRGRQVVASAPSLVVVSPLEVIVVLLLSYFLHAKGRSWVALLLLSFLWQRYIYSVLFIVVKVLIWDVFYSIFFSCFLLAVIAHQHRRLFFLLSFLFLL